MEARMGKRVAMPSLLLWGALILVLLLPMISSCDAAVSVGEDAPSPSGEMEIESVADAQTGGERSEEDPSLVGGLSSSKEPEPTPSEEPEPTPSKEPEPTPSKEPEPTPSEEPEPTPSEEPAYLPTVWEGEYVGELYTREQLENMHKKSNGYGPGEAVNSQNRPIYALNGDKTYKKYDTYFIAPEDGKVYLSYNLAFEYMDLTNKTLDVLKEKGVKAVFFVNIYYVKKNPQTVRRIIDEGHILASHGTHHYNLPTLSIDEIALEITEIHNYVLEQFGYEMTLFRPAYGYYSEQVFAIAHSLGYRTYMYSFSYRDWEEEKPADPEPTLQKMLSSVHSGEIMQLHTTFLTNYQVLSAYIDAVREMGFEFDLLR